MSIKYFSRLSLAYCQFKNVLDHDITRYFNVLLSLFIQSQFLHPLIGCYSGKMVHACQKTVKRFVSLHSVIERSEKLTEVKSLNQIYC